MRAEAMTLSNFLHSATSQIPIRYRSGSGAALSSSAATGAASCLRRRGARSPRRVRRGPRFRCGPRGTLCYPELAGDRLSDRSGRPGSTSGRGCSNFQGAMGSACAPFGACADHNRAVPDGHRGVTMCTA